MSIFGKPKACRYREETKLSVELQHWWSYRHYIQHTTRGETTCSSSNILSYVANDIICPDCVWSGPVVWCHAARQSSTYPHTSSYEWQYKSNKAARDEASISQFSGGKTATFLWVGRGFIAFSRHAPSTENTAFFFMVLTPNLIYLAL